MLTGWEGQKQMNHLSCRSVPNKWRGVQWCAGQCFIPICHICFPRLKSTVKVMKKGQQQNVQDFTIKTPVQGAGKDGPGVLTFCSGRVQFLAFTWYLSIIHSYSFRASSGFMSTEPAHGTHSNLQANPSWAYNKWKSFRKEIHSREDRVFEQNREKKCLATLVQTNKHYRRLGSNTRSERHAQAKRPMSAPWRKVLSFTSHDTQSPHYT